MQLYLYPAKVQGEGAARTIAAGIEMLDTMGMDTIIIGRGGGSIEDLWPFNEECVARAIFHAKTPIISGTGHEIDNTIADYAADLRAPTPSAACELAIPDVASVLNQVKQYENVIKQYMLRHLGQSRQNMQELSARLNSVSPLTRFRNQKIYLDSLQDRLTYAVQEHYGQSRHRFELLLARLDGLSPTARLTGGYGYIEKEGGEALTSVADVKTQDRITVTIRDGRIEGMVTRIEKKVEGEHG